MNCKCKWDDNWPGGIHQCAEHGRWARALLTEQRERDAKVVEKWHLKKGGYTSLAHVIRKGLETS